MAKEKLYGKRNFDGIILYNGTLTHKIADGLLAVPLQTLWNQFSWIDSGEKSIGGWIRVDGIQSLQGRDEIISGVL